jgi:hypothetical protein
VANDIDLSRLDDLADAVAVRLGNRLGRGPAGEPDPRLPAGLEPPVGNDPRKDFLVGSRVGIAGVEYTQSTQFNGSAGASYGRDNAVPLVAYKTMVVRAYPYVRRGTLGGDTLTGQRVVGELTLSVGDRVIFTTGPTRSDGVRIGAQTNIDRAVWDREFTAFGGGPALFAEPNVVVNCSLNFIVPAYYCRRGRIYASVRLWPVADGPMSSRAASAKEYLQFIDVQPPKICLVRVNWSDATGNVTKPTDAQMLDTLGLAERMLPFPYFSTTILSTDLTKSGAFAMLPTKTGGCNTAWTSLVNELNVTRLFTTIFMLGDIVFGMVPQAAIPAGGGKINAGCGIGAGGGFVGFAPVFAHEIGHLYNRPHVAVDGDDTSDASYPNYGGSSTSIGEVGIDTGTSPPTLFDPSERGDIMSYRDDQWISPYTYQKIMDARGMHASAPVDLRVLRPILVVDFRMHRRVNGATHIEIRKAARIAAPGPAPRPPLNAVSPVSLELLDANNRVLAAHHCTWAPPHGGGHCGCGGRSVPLDREPWLDFQEVIEWPEGVSKVVFHRGGDPLHTIDVGEAPSVAIEGPERQEGQLVVRVTSSHTRERVFVVVLFSCGDERWQPIAFDPPDGQVTVDADRLWGGIACVFRAVATAELQSATADTAPFDLPSRPRRLYLHVPSCDCPVPAGPIALAARVDTRNLGPIAPTDIRWSSSLDGDLGAGYSLNVTLSEGRHEVTATAPDGVGGTLNERAIIIVGGRPR